MFHLTRRLYAALPLMWLGIGLLGSAWLMPLPPLLMLAFLLGRHRLIVRSIGTAPLCSDGFAKHVLVDDLLRLGALTLVSPLLFAIGAGLGL
jgi:hypothetical protein